MALKQGDIPSLTGIRGLAAIIVVFYHANLSAVRDLDGYHSLVVFHGYMFVDLFFILSGFVISHVYLTHKDKKISWPLFFITRFARIYPLHIVTAFVAAIGLFLISKMKSSGWPVELTLSQALRELSLTQAMPLFWADSIWNSPSWSISVEFWTYFLIFPIIVSINFATTWRRAAISGSLVLVVLIVYLHCLSGSSTRGFPAFMRAVLCFYAGWATWRCAIHLRDNFIKSWMVNCTFLLLLLLTQLGEYAGHNPWYAIAFMPLLILGCVNTQSMTRKIFESRIMVFFGVISFSIYMWHPLVIKVIQIFLRKFTNYDHNIAIFAVLALMFSIPLGYLSYIFVETPARDGIKRLMN
jgi:peptidoglycan/LPS O-acetylase OafA/YrhL